ncbi:MAG TPA: hypothetical protein VFC74_07435 [Oscillospiraceae bacterium]|nr:hypothetical protein [Oscillospiraceae bacterium]
MEKKQKHAGPAPSTVRYFLASLKEVLQARQAAVSFFNEVTEPAEVDAAIKGLTISENKYKELLQQARQAGYQIPVTLSGFEERRNLFYA